MPNPQTSTPADAKRTKVKLGVLVAIITIGLLWIIISLAGNLSKSRAREPESPQWTTARDTTRKVREDARFVDVDIIPADNDKSRFKVVGSVRDAKALDALKTRLPEVLTGGNYEVDVLVLNPG